MHSLRKSLLTLVTCLVLIGLAPALLPLISQGQGQRGKRDALRRFYLTQTTHNGSQALSACAEGYHMASLWEIHDPSNLSYDAQLGASADDSGSGPPSGLGGWIRTGGPASGIATPGSGNCVVWSRAIGSENGTFARLTDIWSSTAAPGPISPWVADARPCDLGERVWCVQD